MAIIRFYSKLPKSAEAQVIDKQMLKFGTSVGAYYYESIRSRSNAEAISKLECALQELEETRYWFELATESGIIDPSNTSDFSEEADELTAILVTCVKK